MILSKLKLKFFSIKHLIAKRLAPIFEFIWKYAPYYGFYLDVTIVQFFTKTRMGYWFYCCTLLFAFVSPGTLRNLFIFYIIGASANLVVIKSNPKVATFFEKRLGKKAINDIIKENPIWIIINVLKPFFFMFFLVVVTDYTEMHRISQLNRLLLSEYKSKWEFSEEKQTAQKVIHEIVYMMTPPSGLKGGLMLLKSQLIEQPYLSFSLLLILMVIVALLCLKERKGK